MRTSWIASSLRPQRKRFAFVAGNDGVRYEGMTANVGPSRGCERSGNDVALVGRREAQQRSAGEARVVIGFRQNSSITL